MPAFPSVCPMNTLQVMYYAHSLKPKTHNVGFRLEMLMILQKMPARHLMIHASPTSGPWGCRSSVLFRTYIRRTRHSMFFQHSLAMCLRMLFFMSSNLGVGGTLPDRLSHGAELFAIRLDLSAKSHIQSRKRVASPPDQQIS